MVSGELEVAGKPAALSSFTVPSGHIMVASVFPCVVPGSLSAVPFFVSACRTRALTRTDLDTYANSVWLKIATKRVTRFQCKKILDKTPLGIRIKYAFGELTVHHGTLHRKAASMGRQEV